MRRFGFSNKHRLVVLAAVVVTVTSACGFLGIGGEEGTLVATPSEVNLEVGETVDVVVNASNPQDAFTFESSDETIATVDSGGTIVARTGGSATVTVTGITSTVSDTVSVTVTESTVLHTNGAVITSTRYLDNGQIPFVEATLSDGRVVILDDYQYTQEIGARAPDWSTTDILFIPTDPLEPLDPPLLGTSTRAIGARAVTAPSASRISLTRDQTDIRNQAARGLCVSHAVLAAMEAEYRRQGYGTLNLSEQHAQHIAKMQSLVDRTNKKPPTAANYENQLAMGGGGNVYGMIPLMMQYGVPEERFQSYIGNGDFENYSQTGDDPSIVWNDWDTGDYSQELVNSYNTVHDRISIDVPYDFSVNPLPLPALENATYGVTGYQKVPGSELTNPAWYERQIAEDREVIIGMNWISTTDVDTGIVEPRNKNDGESDAGHAVLIVGYDRTDPDNKYFIVKNSWGPRGSREFTKLSYEFLNTDTDGRITQAAVLTGVKDPDRSGFFPALALGRWKISYNGTIGRLDIHRKSEYYPAGSLGGQQDYRLGIFYDDNGDAYRVNGTMSDDGRIEFYIDFSNPSRNYEQRTGTRFVGYIDRNNSRIMTGTYADPTTSVPRSFYAVQDEFVNGVARDTTFAATSFYGEWQIDSPVSSGSVEIRSVDETARTFSGRFYHSGGWIVVSGTADPVTGELAFSLPGVSGVSGLFSGYIQRNNLDTVAGVLDAGRRYSMAMVRVGPATTNIEIDTPTDGEVFTASDAKGADISLTSTVTEDGEEIGDDPGEGTPIVIWTTGAPYGEAGSYIISQSTPDGSAKLAAGTHTIYAHHDTDVVDSVTVVVQASDGPNVGVTTPPDGDYFFDPTNAPYVEVEFLGSASDAEDGGFLTGSDVQWYYREKGGRSWTAGPTGTSATLDLRDTECGGTFYEIRLEATDSDGNVSSDIITVGVDAWGC